MEKYNIANNRITLSFEFVKEYIENNNCKLLSEQYINKNLKLSILFSCGHQGEMSFSCFRRGQRCSLCSKRKRIDSRVNFYRPSKERIEEIANLTNVTILEFPENYKTQKELMKQVCCFGHIEYHKISYFLKCYGCHKCNIVERTKKIIKTKKYKTYEGSSLSSYLKRQIKEWKKESVKNASSYNYKCIICGNDFDDIHHLYSFLSIVKISLKDLNMNFRRMDTDYTREDLEKIVDKVLEKHNEFPLGVCICRKHHTLFHALYGQYNNTPSQFEEFKSRIQSGEIIISQ